MQIAAVPSFSSYEERLHPLIERVAAEIPGARIEKVPDNNILIQVPGSADVPPVALSAHLDKINHFGSDTTSLLPVDTYEGEITGQLDDAVGVGICLQLGRCSRTGNFPPLYILLSEMEESFGLRRHPHLLKNDGAGLTPRIGAERLTTHLITHNMLPALLITIDTSPAFKGKPGVALYCNHWERNGIKPSSRLVWATEEIQQYFLQSYPQIAIVDSIINDYLTYGKLFNSASARPVPCVTIEPAIFPFHQQEESVFISDIVRVFSLVKRFLEDWAAVAIGVSKTSNYYNRKGKKYFSSKKTVNVDNGAEDSG